MDGGLWQQIRYKRLLPRLKLVKVGRKVLLPVGLKKRYSGWHTDKDKHAGVSLAVRSPDFTMAPSFRFFHPLRVRWSEVDPQRIVFNGHYLTYFDIGITEYFRHLGLRVSDPGETGGEFYVRKASLDYHSPAFFDEELQIGVRIGRIGTSSLQFLIGIYRADLLLVSGEVIYVNTDPITRRPAPVSDVFRERVEGFEGV